MPNKRIAKENWMKRLRGFVKSHTSLTVIIAAGMWTTSVPGCRRMLNSKIVNK